MLSCSHFVMMLFAVPFKELLKGVVFALSGFKNPKRGDLREKAVQMGAKYSPDWDKKCTHLICAFENTPKFSQVNRHLTNPSISN